METITETAKITTTCVLFDHETEGMELFSLLIRPEKPGLILEVGASVAVESESRAVVAFFRKGNPHALQVSSGIGRKIYLNCLHPPGNTNEAEFCLRVGPAPAGMLMINPAAGDISEIRWQLFEPDEDKE